MGRSHQSRRDMTPRRDGTLGVDVRHVTCLLAPTVRRAPRDGRLR